MTKNSLLVNSRANSSTIGSILGSKSFKDMKSENSKVKRKELLQIHEECLRVLQ
jgi:hypothetical protein